MTTRDLRHIAFAASVLLASAAGCGGDKSNQPATPAAAPAAPPPTAPAPSAAPEAPPTTAPAPAPTAAPVEPTTPAQPAAPEHVTPPTRDNDTSVPTVTAAKHAQAPAPEAKTKVVPPAPAAAPTPPPAPAVAAPKPVEPPPAVAPAAAPVSKVVVPRTDHVHIDVPKGLQAWLDADTRMQPWLGKVISVIDGCYANARKDDPKTAGVIAINITMHKDERPDADIASAPSQLGGVIGCATTKLLGARPPLFTGKEGEKYTVHVHFDK